MIENVLIRDGTPKDATDVARVNIETWKTSFRKILPSEFLDSLSINKRAEALKDRFKEDLYSIKVAHVQDQIIGFCDFGAARNIEDIESEIFAIYILQDFQRMGIGSELFTEAVRLLNNQSCKSMIVRVFADSPYIDFYKSRNPEFYGNNVRQFGDKNLTITTLCWRDLSQLSR